MPYTIKISISRNVYQNHMDVCLMQAKLTLSQKYSSILMNASSFEEVNPSAMSSSTSCIEAMQVSVKICHDLHFIYLAFNVDTTVANSCYSQILFQLCSSQSYKLGFIFTHSWDGVYSGEGNVNMSYFFVENIESPFTFHEKANSW